MFLLSILLGVIGLCLAMYNGKISMHVNTYGDILITYLSAVSTIFALILFVKLFSNKLFLFKMVGKYSLFYMGYHLIAITIIRFYFPKFLIGTINTFFTAVAIYMLLLPLAYIVYNYVPIFVGKINQKKIMIPKKQSI